mmetsp:Transcript_63586/g.137720  ORF Transcript_63586/g.137720 Transcript_63586/m.137720 type:complete len:229 (-) Transcript_63586:89-775(-)
MRRHTRVGTTPSPTCPAPAAPRGWASCTRGPKTPRTSTRLASSSWVRTCCSCPRTRARSRWTRPRCEASSWSSSATAATCRPRRRAQSLSGSGPASRSGAPRRPARPAWRHPRDASLSPSSATCAASCHPCGTTCRRPAGSRLVEVPLACPWTTAEAAFLLYISCGPLPCSRVGLGALSRSVRSGPRSEAKSRTTSGHGRVLFSLGGSNAPGLKMLTFCGRASRSESR